jgi:hypothetical protein
MDSINRDLYQQRLRTFIQERSEDKSLPTDFQSKMIQLYDSKVEMAEEAFRALSQEYKDHVSTIKRRQEKQWTWTWTKVFLFALLLFGLARLATEVTQTIPGSFFHWVFNALEIFAIGGGILAFFVVLAIGH